MASEKAEAETSKFTGVRNSSEKFIYRVVDGKPELRSIFGQFSWNEIDFDDETFSPRNGGNILEGNFATAKIAKKIIRDAQINLSSLISEDSPETLDAQRTMLSKESRL